ncbi:hypothetical protein V7S57_02475 [Caulobacter sp. CCNWLY153]|uniref:hypothetical protein n=1 Tax=unclassified Caulobacter TaxID=2648921 RepID=UPI002FF2EE95
MTPLQRAADYLSVPYVRHGHSLEGWDCLGCLKVAGQILFAKDFPYGADFYAPTDGDDPERKHALFAAQLPRWRETTAGPGRAVLFSRCGLFYHVGLMLDARWFLHAETPAAGTQITRLAGIWLRRQPRFMDAF